MQTDTLRERALAVKARALTIDRTVDAIRRGRPLQSSARVMAKALREELDALLEELPA